MESLRISVLLFSTLILLVQGVLTKEHYCLHKTRLTIFIDLKEMGKPFYGGRRYYGANGHFHDLQNLIITVENVLRDPCYEARLYYQLEKRFLKLIDIKTQFEKVFENLKFNT